MKRRDLLHTALLTGVASALLAKRSTAAEDDNSFAGIIDANVSLFHWPFRRLPLDDTDKLLSKLHSLGISTAFAGTFEGLLHRDLRAANARLSDACARHPELVAIGSINPALPDWEHDLHRCATDHRMPGIRLNPNYHGYGLADVRFHRLLDTATDAGLFVQLAVSMEDTRTQSSLVPVPDVDLASLADVVSKVPAAHLHLLNYKPRGAAFLALTKLPNIHFDIALADGTDGVAKLLAVVAPDRVLYGSHAPFLIPEAALIRVHESALEPAILLALLRGNAEHLLASAKS